MASVHDRATEIYEMWMQKDEISTSPEVHTTLCFWAYALAYLERRNMAKAAQFATMAMAACQFSDCPGGPYEPPVW